MFDLASQVLVFVYTLDVRETDKITGLPLQLPPVFAEVDILVNNAGLALGTAPVTEISIEVWAARTGKHASCAKLQTLAELIAGRLHPGVQHKHAELLTGVDGPSAARAQDMQTMLQTNVAGVAVFTRTFAPGMVARNRGHIVNISSVAGHEAYAGALMHLSVMHLLHATYCSCAS